MKEIIIKIPDDDFYKRKMNSLSNSLGKKEIENLRNVIRKESLIESLYQMCYGAETYNSFGLSSIKKRKEFFPYTDKAYITFYAYNFLEIMMTVVSDLNNQNTYVEEFQLVSQPASHKLSHLAALFYRKLYKHFENPTWPFEGDVPF